MDQLQTNKRYESVGFVEALIAIAVAGIASLVLMSIAAETISVTIQNEISDQMTQQAIVGSSMVKKIADNHNKEVEEVFFPKIEGNENICLAFDGDVNEPAFLKNGDVFTNVCNYDSGDRENCKSAIAVEDSEKFRIFCYTSESDSARGLVIGKVVVGLRDCSSEITSGKCALSDYEYFVAVKVDQRD